jgi:hypothetical protein
MSENPKCPRCGKELDEKHQNAIAKGALAVAVLGNHIRSIEKRDLYCIECFEETETGK